MDEHVEAQAEDTQPTPVAGEPEGSATPETATPETATRETAAGDDPASSTGVAAVDEVVASVRGLDGVPVDEHVAVFEQAHERLRRALDSGQD